MNINSQAPVTGRVIAESGEVTNIADMLAMSLGVPPVPDIKANAAAHAPHTGRIISESGQVYNAVDFLRAILDNVGDGGGGGTTNHALLNNLDFANSRHTGFASQSELNAVREIANGQFSLIWAQINAIQAMGKKVGIYATASDLPPDTSHPDATGATENDWALISDDAAIYLIDSIDGSGVIAWKFGFAFETAPAQMLFSTVPFDENSLLPGQVGGVYDDA